MHPDRDDAPTAVRPDESVEAWRWRSYVAHLSDLGYDLDAGGPPDDGLDEAVTGYRQRLHHAEP